MNSVYGMTKPVGNGKTNCGACAEYVAISERCVAVMPKTTSYLEAASFPLIALTTVQGIGRYVRDGTKILIIGGSSGVGSFAVQYAKAKGCYVSSTCSTKNLEMVSGLGADRVIDYTKENWGDLLAGGEYDVIFDCVGGIENWNSSSRVLKKKGNFVTIAGDVQDQMSVSRLFGIAGSWIGRNVMSLFNNPQYSYFTCNATRAHVQLIEVRQLIDGGFIKPVIDPEGIFTMDKLGDAFEKSMGGRTRGKIVIIIDEEHYQKNPSEMKITNNILTESNEEIKETDIGDDYE